MDLIAGLAELITQMEEDLTAAESTTVKVCITSYIRSLKMLIKAATPKVDSSSDGGVSVSIGGSSQPQQPPPPSRPFKANRKSRDPWDEAQKRAVAERRIHESQSDPGDEDSDDYN